MTGPRPIASILIGLGLIAALVLSACGATAPPPGFSPTQTPTLTPTPTRVIGAVEITPTAPGETAPTTGSASCLDHPSQSSRSGPPCLKGSYNVVYSLTIHTTDHQTEVIDSPLAATFLLWAVSAGQVEGTAHLTYSVKATYQDTQSSSCPVSTEVVAPFSWDVVLKGQYSKRSDGSIQVIALANPGHGPGYTARITDCPVPDRQEPGVNWIGPTAQLINGVFDHRQDNPIPANATGEYYTTLHLEVAKNP